LPQKIRTMKSFAYMNGAILPLVDAHLHITDLALLRGYGVFDFFKSVNGKPIFIEDHLDRFEKSMELMGLDIPYTRGHLRDHILKLIQLNEGNLLGIKLLCTGGYSEDGYTPTTPNLIMFAKPFTFAAFNQGLKLMLLEHQRELHQIKTINYIQPITVLPKLNALKADDVLYHQNGFVSEASRSNLFMVKNKKVITPKDDILLGVTRKHVLKIAQKSFETEVRPVTLKDLAEADEVFLTGSTKRIAPVTQIDNYHYPIGKVTENLYHLLLEKEAQAVGIDI
jgi:branched-chain amino acid aminotransferase